MAQREVSAAEVARATREGVHMFISAGFIYARVLPDGRCLYLAPAPQDPTKILLGIARNIVDHDYYAVWEYAPREDAMWRAVLGWDGNDEPVDYLPRSIHPSDTAGGP